MAAFFGRRQPNMIAPPTRRTALAPARRLGTPGTAAVIVVVHLIAATLGAGHRFTPAPPADSRTLRLDPNIAPRADLMLLPGIGPALADGILEYRNSLPPPAFRSPQDLGRVRRIGPATVEKLAPHLRFDSPATSRAGSPP